MKLQGSWKKKNWRWPTWKDNYRMLSKRTKLEVQLRQFKSQLGQIEFIYANLIHYPEKFFYMTGLTATEFHCVFEVIESFVHLMVYPDYKGSGMETKSRKLDL